jgi:predicted AAA+ superfamily ATPase
LKWGNLPTLFQLEDEGDKSKYLQSYVRTYLSEEIQKEQIVRNLDPFRYFLEIAAQFNGKVINYSNVSKGIGVDPKTVASYYKILEDTLLGSFLLPFSYSFRKKLLKAPKFYFFDTGVSRALGRQLSLDLSEGNSYFGEVFEQFIVNQVLQSNAYSESEFRVSYYRDENDIEIDLVIERPGQKILFLEIKSAHEVFDTDCKSLNVVSKDFPEAELQVWSNSKVTKKLGKVLCLNWAEGLKLLFPQ